MDTPRWRCKMKGDQTQKINPDLHSSGIAVQRSSLRDLHRLFPILQECRLAQSHFKQYMTSDVSDPEVRSMIMVRKQILILIDIYIQVL